MQKRLLRSISLQRWQKATPNSRYHLPRSSHRFRPQGNCATSFGVEKKKIKKTAYDLLVNDSGEDLPLMEEYIISPAELTESMQKAWSKRNDNSNRVPEDLSIDNLWLLPSDIHLSGAEIELSHRIGRETRLREALAPIIDQFDHIIIDTPPSLGLLSINALCAANWVFIPVQAEYYALKASAC